jgi:leader peptidase (prepilin peptidase)/N-methyltransferase
MTGIEIALTALLVAALIALAVIDIRTYRLPDWLTLPLIPAGLAAAWWLGETLWLHALGAVAGYGVLVALEKTYEKMRGRPGLGRGDAKLFAAGGAWCGLTALPLVLLAASVSALIWVMSLRLAAGVEVRADTMIAFGPFLGFGIGFIFIAKRLGLLAFAGV